jgi:hypothetical protein
MSVLQPGYPFLRTSKAISGGQLNLIGKNAQPSPLEMNIGAFVLVVTSPAE